MADGVKVKVGGDASGLKSEFEKVGGYTNKLKGWIVGALGALGVNLSWGFLKGHIDRIDELGKKARGLGLAADEFQKIQIAADLAGVGMDTLSTGIANMSNILGDAKNGGEAAQKTLHALGYTLTDFDGKTVYQQLGLVMDGIAGIADKNQQMAAIRDIFGKAGKDMVDFVNQYTRAIEDARNAGTIIDKEAIASAEEFNDALQRIQLKGIAALMNGGFIEWLEKVAGEMDKVVSISAQMSKNGMTETNNESWMKRAARVAVDWNPFTGGPSALLGLTTGKNLSDYIFGAKDITYSTPEVPIFAGKKEVESLKAKQDAERKNRVEIEKSQADMAKGLEANIKAENDWRKKEEDAKDKIEETISSLDQKYKIQLLINAGKKREAEISQAIYDAEKTAKEGNYTLTDAQRKNITAAAGNLYDSQNKKNRFEDIKMPVYSDALSRIGGYTGTSVTGGDQILSQAKKQTSLLEQIRNNTQQKPPSALDEEL